MGDRGEERRSRRGRREEEEGVGYRRCWQETSLGSGTGCAGSECGCSLAKDGQFWLESGYRQGSQILASPLGVSIYPSINRISWPQRVVCSDQKTSENLWEQRNEIPWEPHMCRCDTEMLGENPQAGNPRNSPIKILLKISSSSGKRGEAKQNKTKKKS